MFCVLANGVISLGILEHTLPFTSIACCVIPQTKTNKILLGTTKLQTALYAEERWTVYQLNNQGLKFCGDVGSTPGQYFHGDLWMFRVVLLTFASSARLGGATNTWMEGISITVFIYWACERETAVNKLQFSFKVAIWSHTFRMGEPFFSRKEIKYCKGLFIDVNPHSNNFLKRKKKRNLLGCKPECHMK